MRHTKQRAAILAALHSTNQHPTADWVYAEVRKALPHISLGTVYRTLHLLAEEGAIGILPTGRGPHRYDGHPGAHDHIVCTECGRMADVPKIVAANASEEVERWTNFTVSSLQLTWRGLCADCRAQRRASE